MTTVTAIRRTRPRPTAQHALPSGSVLPLGKQLAHTGEYAPAARLPRSGPGLIPCADKKVRDAAFANVIAFLSNGGITKLTAPIEDASGVLAAGEETERDVRRGQLPPVEMRRLWKGLFYCTCFKLCARTIPRVCVPLSTSQAFGCPTSRSCNNV